MLDSLSSDERRDLILSIGTHKKNRRLSPIQVAQLLNRLYQIQGISLKEIALFYIDFFPSYRSRLKYTLSLIGEHHPAIFPFL